MQKHFLLVVAFLFFAGSFLCEAQPNVAAKKTGTLSNSTSSGSGAYPICNITINTAGSYLCVDSSLQLSLNYTISNADSMSFSWYSADSTIFIDTTYNNFSGPTNGSTGLIVNHTGIYNFDLYLNNTLGSSDCHYTWVITSTVPVTFPQNTILCAGGADTLLASTGSFQVYQWFNNGDSIIGATSNSYIASNEGNYTFQTTDLNGCVLGSDEVNVTIYPVPDQPAITGNSYVGTDLMLDNTAGKLYPENITWFRNGNPIKTFDNKGITVAGGNGAGSGLNQFDMPYGIFLDSIKNLYVADYNNNRVMKWIPGSTSGEILAGNYIGFHWPTDVVMDSGFFYISSAQYLAKFTPPSTFENIGGTNVWGVSIGADHDPHVTYDPGVLAGGAVLVFYLSNGYYNSFSEAGDGNLGSSLSSLNYPNGIYQDLNYNFYIADNLYDSLNNNYGRILKWAPGAASGTLVAGGNGSGNAPDQIAFAAGVAFDKHGNLYITDPVDNRVQIWEPGAHFGINMTSGFAPWGIKVDDSDNVFVADQTNDQVLKFPGLLYNSIRADTPGVYKATITYAGGCSVTSNDFTVYGPLSITILDLFGQQEGRNVTLTWQTTLEHNTSYFTVERSVNGSDFIDLGKVEAIGNSNQLHNYSYFDNYITGLNVPVVFYRLKETDMDGSSVESNVISVDVTIPDWKLAMSPNPVRGWVKVQLNNLYGNTSIEMLDIAGRMLSARQINASGNDVITFNTSNLPGGMYIIKVRNGSRNGYLKLVKE